MDISQIHELFLKSAGVCTDTRNLKENQLFIALKGDNFDGNKYATNAISNGASHAIIDDPKITGEKTILVSNTLDTLQKLAKYHRTYLDIPIIALTGSNGKTTTKELISAVLKTQYKCIATIGNLNNHIGVPLTLLSMNKETELGVVEMGANHLKEIAALSKIAAPNYGYITNIGKAHLEGFGSEDNILIGKTELYDFIKETNGILFCNADDRKLFPLAKETKTVFFSKENDTYNKITLVNTNPFVSVKFKDNQIDSKLIGNYNYSNIAASIAIGNYFKISHYNIKTAIENYIPSNNRSELVTKGSNKIILDAYNANPSSMHEALKHLDSTLTDKKQKIAVLGDMFEMGKYALTEHQLLADSVIDKNIDKVLLVGENFSNCKINSNKIQVFQDVNSLISHLTKVVYTDSLFLIKGSRGMKLEQTLITFE